MPWLPIDTGRRDVFYDLLKRQGVNLMRSFPYPWGSWGTHLIHQWAPSGFSGEIWLKIPIEGWILLWTKIMLAAIVQQSHPLEWVTYHPGGHSQSVFYSWLKNWYDHKNHIMSFQYYGKDPSKLILPFKIKDLEWATSLGSPNSWSYIKNYT